MSRYNFKDTEAKWQRLWEERGSFTAREAPGRPKYYVLEMFPYPSGRIHMGHVRNYTMGDVVARFKRARGMNVLHPMAWTPSACRPGTPRWSARSIPGNGPTPTSPR